MSCFHKKWIDICLRVSVGLIVVLMAQPGVSLGASVKGSDLPLIDGARIIKEKHAQNIHQVELEVDLPPMETAEFYNNAMQARGWPEGRILSNGKISAFILKRQGGQFTLKAEAKDGRTLVTIVLVEIPQANSEKKAGGIQPQGLPALKGATGTGSPAKAAPEKSIRLPIQTPVADHRLAMFLATVSEDSFLEPDKPLVIHFSGPVEPAFFDFKIKPDMGKWAAQWSKDFSHVTLVPDFPLQPGQNLHLKATVLGGPEIDRTLQIRRLSPARQLAHDLKTGRIDINQAARYRLFRLFKAEGVPEAYRPVHSPASGTPTLVEIEKSFYELDDPTRREILPYLLSPRHPDSIWRLKLYAGTGGDNRPEGLGLVSTAWADSGPLREIYHTDTGYKVVIWGEPGLESQVRQARSLVEDTKMYEQFERLMGRKTVDPGDNELNIFLFRHLRDVDEKGREIDEPYGQCSAFEYDPEEPLSVNKKLFLSPSFYAVPTISISTSMCSTPRLLGATLSHEMFHAFQAAFNRLSPAWLAESTAVWAEHKITSEWNTEQVYIEDAFDDSSCLHKPLETEDDYTPYGMYLLPFYLTEVDPGNDQVIRKIWERMESHSSAAESVAGAVADFDRLWKGYILATMDVDPKDKRFPDVKSKWGKSPLELKDKHKFKVIKLSKEGTGSAVVILEGLDASYYKVVNNQQGPTAPAITFDLRPLIRHAKVSIQAIVYYRDGRREYQDWTDFPERLFCLNKPADNFSSLYLVVASSQEKRKLGGPIVEQLAISPEPSSRCRSGVVTLTRIFEEREQLDSTRRITMAATETQSRRASGSRSVTLRLDLDLSERILPEQRDALDQMEARVENAKADQVKQVRKMMENIIKTPQAQLDKETGLMKVRYRVKNCRIDTGGGAYRSRSQGVRTDADGISTQWETNFTRNWSATGITTDTRKRIERGHIRADVFYEPETGRIQWVRVPQLDIDMHVTENSSGYYTRRSQDGYQTTPKNGGDSKDETFNMTYSSGGKARKGLPMDPVWRAKVSTPFMANGGGRQESPIDQKWDEVNRKGSRNQMLVETFNWSINLGDGPATPNN